MRKIHTGQINNNIYLELLFDNTDIVQIHNVPEISANLHKFQVVNSLGVMGKGLALQFRNEYPDLEQWYKNHENLALGNLLKYPLENDNMLINLVAQSEIGNAFITKKRYLNYSALESALQAWHTSYIRDKEDKIPLACIPYKMGCGLAGGDWNIVLNLIRTYIPIYAICKYPW